MEQPLIRLINVTDNISISNIPKNIIANKSYFIYSMIPICINKVEDSNNTYYIEFLCDVISEESQEYIYLILGFKSDSDNFIIEHDLYIDNIQNNKRSLSIYEKLIRGSNLENTFQTEFNMSLATNMFHECILVSIKDKHQHILNLNKNMFFKIALFLDGLLSHASILTSLFTEDKYNLIEKEEINNNQIPAKSKIIVNDDSVYCIYKTNKLHYIEMSLDDFKKIKGNIL